MDDWEAVGNSVKVVENWEDEAEDIPESWDVEDSPKEEAKPKVQTSKKLTAKEKIARKEAERQKIVEEMMEKEKELKDRQLTEKEREELAKEAEKDVIIDSFGVGVPTSGSEFDFSKISTKQDFDDLSDKLSAKLKTLETSPHFSAFAESLIRGLSLTMELDNLKSVSSCISALINEKQKSSAKNKPKKKKKALVLERNAVDVDTYGDDVVGDDYDDFM